MKQPAAQSATAERRSFKQIVKENKGFFFILPWLIGFLIFKVYPFGSSLVYGLSFV